MLFTPPLYLFTRLVGAGVDGVGGLGQTAGGLVSGSEALRCSASPHHSCKYVAEVVNNSQSQI